MWSLVKTTYVLNAPVKCVGTSNMVLVSQHDFRMLANSVPSYHITLELTGVTRIISNKTKKSVVAIQ